MEESEKRRERLRAMRAEANDAGTSRSFPAPALSNPMTEVAAPEEARSRFDFYTDPMSAFTRSNPAIPGTFFRRPGPEMPPHFQGQQHYPPCQSPISRPPYNAHPGNQSYPVAPGYGDNRPFNGGGQGRSSPRPGGSGWRGGRGRGHSSGPGRFYNESMVEDPWKFLEPVVWAEVRPPISWVPTPASVCAKKARVSDASNKVDSQPSLAEYLAASFNEAVGDAPST